MSMCGDMFTHVFYNAFYHLVSNVRFPYCRIICLCNSYFALILKKKKKKKGKFFFFFFYCSTVLSLRVILYHMFFLIV